MSNQISKRLLGKTGIELSELSFGVSSLGNLYRAVSDEEAVDVLDAVWNAGIRYMDVAPHYGFGLAETRLGRYLAGKKNEDYVVSTKVGRILEPVDACDVPDFGFVDPLQNRPVFDYSYDGIMRSYEQSLSRMPDAPVRILYIHDIGEDTHSKEENARHVRDLLEGGFKALDELKSTTEVSAVGLGVNEVEICLQLAKEYDLDALLLAGRYTLLDRSAENELLDVCKQRNIGLVIGGVFNSGILATGAVPGAYYNYEPATPEICDKVNALDAACKEHDVKLATASLRFALNSDLVASVLVGTGRVSSLKRSIDAMQETIPDALWPICDEIARA
nr:aldo/keto reductase [uncultured Cohaesibacter sp.]